MGSRRRYLAEQDAFMRDVLGYEVQPVRKMGERMAARYTGAMLRGADRNRAGVQLDKPGDRVPLRRKAARAGRLVRREAYERLATDATPLVRAPAELIGKAEPLKTHMKESDAKRVVGQYGLAGALPKTLTREQKMGAYEARYVAAGGRKGERWQRRAERSDKVKTVGLAVATAGGAGILATRAKPVARMMGAKGTRVRRAADTTALIGATGSGAAELDAGRARRKRASYASAPGGVAASALRRMRAMDEARSR